MNNMVFFNTIYLFIIELFWVRIGSSGLIDSSPRQKPIDNCRSKFYSGAQNDKLKNTHTASTAIMTIELSVSCWGKTQDAEIAI